MNTKNRLNPTKTKRNLKQLSILNQTKLTSLQEHSNKIEQKLNLLKEKIEQKKKVKKVQQKKQEEIKDEPQLLSFLQSIGMTLYKQKLINNHIDSFQILSEATQKELQQLSIPKGHCIKIVTNIQKYKKSKLIPLKVESQGKIQKQLHRQLKTKESDRVTNHEQILQKQFQSICIGGDSIPIQIKKSYFCLYCYKKSSNQFCSQNCQKNYGMMFKKYEDNLIKVEQNFKKQKKIQKEQSEQQQYVELQQNFDFLGIQFQKIQGFDYQTYEELKKQLQ